MQGSDARAIRKALGLTLKEMAQALGMSEKYVGMMERGEAPIERRTQLALLYLGRFPEDADNPKPEILVKRWAVK